MGLRVDDLDVDDLVVAIKDFLEKGVPLGCNTYSPHLATKSFLHLAIASGHLTSSRFIMVAFEPMRALTNEVVIGEIEQVGHFIGIVRIECLEFRGNPVDFIGSQNSFSVRTWN